MKRAGAQTVAQNEETCVVFGMPREALKRGGVERTVPRHRARDHAPGAVSGTRCAYIDFRKSLLRHLPLMRVLPAPYTQ